MKNTNLVLEKQLISAYLKNRTVATRNQLAEYYVKCELHREQALRIWKLYGNYILNQCSGLEIGDMETELVVTMLDAITKYNPTKGSSMYSWVSFRMNVKGLDIVRNLCKESVRQQKLFANAADLSESTAWVVAGSLDDWVPSGISYAHQVTVCDLHDAITSLDEPYYSIILFRYFFQASNNEIATMLGKGSSWVSQCHKKGLGLLESRLHAIAAQSK